MLVDRVQGEPPAGHLDERQRARGVWRVALQPLVDSLVGDAEVGIVGECRHDARHAHVAHPSTELSVPPRGDSSVAPSGEGVMPKHPLASWRAGQIRGAGNVLPPKDKGGVSHEIGDRVRQG